jgi:hypothetical protein
MESTGQPSSPPVVSAKAEVPSPAAAGVAKPGRVDKGGLEPAPRQPDQDIVAIELDSMGLDEQVKLMSARWAGLERRMARLSERVVRLERHSPKSDEIPAEVGGAARESLPVDTPQNRRTALVASGVTETQADDIVWRQSQLAMQRLELQDQAMREGWFRSERYFEELRAMNRDDIELRTEIGEDNYDRYLYQTGEPNRVKIRTVIQGSNAEGVGLQPGDVIEYYGSQRIFDFDDLRDATTSGERDELVPLTVRRGDAVFDTWIARGPIGVRLESAAAAPES